VFLRASCAEAVADGGTLGTSGGQGRASAGNRPGRPGAARSPHSEEFVPNAITTGEEATASVGPGLVGVVKPRALGGSVRRGLCGMIRRDGSTAGHAPPGQAADGWLLAPDHARARQRAAAARGGAGWRAGPQSHPKPS